VANLQDPKHSRGLFHGLIPSLCLLAASAVLPATAVELEDHDHAVLPVDAGMTLAEVVERTVEYAPAYVELEARQALADAWQNRGDSWMSGPLALTVRYQSDRWGNDLGLQEIESGIQFTLWKWGQRRSTRELGRSLQTEADAAPAALRWEIAGLIRRLVWEIERTEAELELLEESEVLAAKLAATVNRRYELGDVARREVLLARSAELDVAARVAEARVAMTDAERTYRSVTGLDRRPVTPVETLSTRAAIDASHPALQLATAAVEGARAARGVVRESGITSPTLMIGPRRERSVFGQDFEDSVGIFVTVPFGGRSHIDTQVTAAGRLVAAREAELRATSRELELGMHEAAHSLSAARHNVKLARERAELAQEGYEMGELAYSRGEIGLIELLSLQEVYLDARRQAAQFGIEVNRQTALYNHAVGVMP
jgi:outer membrane protein TolC